MSASAPPKPASRKRTAILCTCFLLAVAGIAWSLDGWLLARLRIIASDTFASGNPEHPMLFPDGSEELRTYPPQRLLKFLSTPSPQIRSVVCLSLSDRIHWYVSNQRSPDEATWVGVARRLIDVFMNDKDAQVRDCAGNALAMIPLVPTADVEAVLDFVEGPRPNDDQLRTIRISLIHKSVKTRPDLVPRIAAYYRRWMKSSALEDRKAAFLHLRVEAPHDPVTLAVFRELMDAGDPDGIGSDGGRWMLERHPSLIEPFLDGNAAQKRLMLHHALEQVQGIAYQRKPAPTIHFNNAQLEKVDREASWLLETKSPIEVVRKACEFLSFRPDGAETLIAGAKRTSGANRAAAVSYATWAVSRRTSVRRAPPLQDVLPWLHESDALVRGAVVSFCFAHPDWRASENEKPSAVLDALRRCYDEFPGQAAYYNVRMLLDLRSQCKERDVDRVAAAAEKALRETEQSALKANSFFGCNEADDFEHWLAANPHHRERASVKKCLDFRAELVKKNLTTPFGWSPK